VSEVTNRADLAALEGSGMLRRVRGGALAVPTGAREAAMEASAERDADVKRAIGRRAAGLVASGSSVFLDVGSTTLEVARALVDRRDLADVVVLTNGLAIALALEPAVPRFTVVVTGGTLRPLQHSLVAPIAVDTVAGLHADLAILGCTGIDEDGVVSNVNLPESEVKRAMIAAADRRVLVADASKAGVRHLAAVGHLRDFAVLVTGGGPVGAIRAAAAAAGTRVLDVDAP
jgi:DeoR family transcriptional regulator of aga operon